MRRVEFPVGRLVRRARNIVVDIITISLYRHTHCRVRLPSGQTPLAGFSQTPGPKDASVSSAAPVPEGKGVSVMSREIASTITVAEFRSSLLASRPPLLIDVRRHAAFQGATDLIEGALWRDPERVGEWAGELPRASHVVVYCVHGHEVSQGVAKALRESGRAARYLEGGVEAWKAEGGALGHKPRLANTRWGRRERHQIDRL